jgi:uncharacterized protein YcfJ
MSANPIAVTGSEPRNATSARTRIKNRRKRQLAKAIAGAVVGGIVAGPVGVVAGAAAGATVRRGPMRDRCATPPQPQRKLERP